MKWCETKMQKFELLLFFLAGLVVNCALGEILCYTCVSQGGGDDTCIKNPAAVSNPMKKCTYKYCTIRRIEYASEPGVIQSFLRGCEDNPLPNGENASPDMTVWAQSCNYGDLCNVGDGLTPLKPGSGNGGGGGAEGPIVVLPPSTNAGTYLQYFGIHITTVLTLVVYVFL